MTDLPFFDTYTGQTTAELLALEGQYRIDSLVLAFEDAVSQKFDSEVMTSLSTEELCILAIEGLEREVNNGGYHQFFSNSSCLFAPRTADALRRIGRDDLAALTEQAIGLLEITDAVTAETIEAAAAVCLDDDARMERLELLDQRYFETAGDLATPLFAYIKAHQASITIGPSSNGQGR